MKYGETLFDILYLAFALICVFLILRRAKNAAQKQMG